MDALSEHTGVAVPILRANIDTDAIIPSREMRRVSKQGLGEGLFAGWRYLQAGSRDPKPEFVLNQAVYAGCSILLTGENFGCGSSREHAVWALKEFGIRVIVAPSFGAIFQTNCVRNGILPITQPMAIVEQLAARVAEDAQQRQLTIRLEEKCLFDDEGQCFRFDIAESQRQMLLQGLDPIALTLKHESSIEEYEALDRERRPWAYLS